MRKGGYELKGAKNPEQSNKSWVGTAAAIGAGALVGTAIGNFIQSGIMKGGPVTKR